MPPIVYLIPWTLVGTIIASIVATLLDLWDSPDNDYIFPFILMVLFWPIFLAGIVYFFLGWAVKILTEKAVKAFGK